jgi:hypothetical protein
MPTPTLSSLALNRLHKIKEATEMAQFQFNARDVEPDQGRKGAIPAGWYKTMVTKTELKPTGSGEGMMIAVSFQVAEGTYKGAMFFNNFNVQNPNEKAVEIGRKQLSALCHAVNVLEMSDTDQLKNIPFFTRLKLTPAVMDDQNPGVVKYEEKNEPSAYSNLNDQAAIAGAAKTASATQAAAKPAGTAPGTIPPAANVIPPQQPMAPAQQWQANAQQPMAPQQPSMQPQQMQLQFQAPQQQQQAPQFQAPAQQFQTAPQQQAPQQFQPGAVQGQPDWAAAPQQPWGAPQAAAPQQVAPVMSPEQQAAYAASQAAPVPWGAPQ